MSQVQLLKGSTASDILFGALSVVQSEFASEFDELGFPRNTSELKARYVDFLPEFEAIRLQSKHRCKIAERLVHYLNESVVWGESANLIEHLQSESGPLTLSQYQGKSVEAWKFQLDYRARSWSNLSDLSDELLQRDVITPAAAQSLHWVDEGNISLKGRRIVVLGAAAEMASTELFLKLGADVLWIDKVAPPKEWSNDNDFSGNVYFCSNGADLLTQPAEVLATINKFASSQAVDICLYAYAPGQARETRLTVVMNQIVNCMPRSMVASVSLLVSPTTPTALSDLDLQRIKMRHKNRPGWEGLLDQLRVFGSRGGIARRNDASTCRSVVSIQGVSYQVAQYIGKVLSAELWHEKGYRVSANTAAITRTRSLSHPVFDAAFGGAESLSVETFNVEQSRCLSGLLTIADWLSPEPINLAAKRIHGGIHCLPYPLELALRPAAIIGFLKRPQLLAGFVR